MFQVLLVGVGGFIGAILRYGLSGMVHRYTHPGFPWGTLLVNVLGCLVIGAVMCLVEYRQVFSCPSQKLRPRCHVRTCVIWRNWDFTSA